VAEIKATQTIGNLLALLGIIALPLLIGLAIYETQKQREEE